MNKIKKIIIILFFQTLTTNNLFSTTGNISLNRIKDKIEKASDKAISLTKKNVKNFLKTSKDKLLDEKETNKIALAKAIITTGNATVIGLENIYAKAIAKKIKQIDKFLTKKTKWANETKLIKELKQLCDTNKDNARQLFHDKIVEKYPNQKTPLLLFAIELKDEQENLEKILAKINELTTRNNDTKKYLEEDEFKIALEKLNKAQNNFDIIYEITDSLLS